jgi:hypothetical protein
LTYFWNDLRFDDDLVSYCQSRTKEYRSLNPGLMYLIDEKYDIRIT